MPLVAEVENHLLLSIFPLSRTLKNIVHYPVRGVET